MVIRTSITGFTDVTGLTRIAIVVVAVIVASARSGVVMGVPWLRFVVA